MRRTTSQREGNDALAKSVLDLISAHGSGCKVEAPILFIRLAFAHLLMDAATGKRNDEITYEEVSFLREHSSLATFWRRYHVRRELRKVIRALCKDHKIKVIYVDETPMGPPELGEIFEYRIVAL